MTERIKLRLHYWNCRGRSQAFRYMLEEIAYKYKNVDYQEEFEEVTTLATKWPERKADPAISGPFLSLPVLHWNEKESFGQTLIIAHVLARKFDLYGQLTSSYTDPILLEGYLNGIVTCAYTDVIGNTLLCLWRDIDLENTTSLNYASIRIIHDGLESLNTLLKQSSTPYFYDQVEPTVADYFAFEAYLLARDMHHRLLPTNVDALEKLEPIMKNRPALANYFQNGRLLKRITAAPHEADYLSKIAQIR